MAAVDGNTVTIVFFVALVCPFVCVTVILVCCIVRYRLCYSSRETKWRKSSEKVRKKIKSGSTRPRESVRNKTERDRLTLAFYNPRTREEHTSVDDSATALTNPTTVKKNEQLNILKAGSVQRSNSRKDRQTLGLDNCDDMSTPHNPKYSSRSASTIRTTAGNVQRIQELKEHEAVEHYYEECSNTKANPPTVAGGKKLQISAEIHENTQNNKKVVDDSDDSNTLLAPVYASIDERPWQHSEVRLERVDINEICPHELVQIHCTATIDDNSSLPAQATVYENIDNSDIPSEQDYTYVPSNLSSSSQNDPVNVGTKSSDMHVSTGPQSHTTNEAQQTGAVIGTSENIAYPTVPSRASDEQTLAGDTPICTSMNIAYPTVASRGTVGSKVVSDTRCIYREQASSESGASDHSKLQSSREKQEHIDIIDKQDNVQTDKHTSQCGADLKESNGQDQTTGNITTPTRIVSMYDEEGHFYHDC